MQFSCMSQNTTKTATTIVIYSHFGNRYVYISVGPIRNIYIT